MSVKVAIIGSGNIGTDLMVKIVRGAGELELAAMVGIDPDSPGLARAARWGIATTSDGVEGLLALPAFADIGIVFDATSAGAHRANAAALQPSGVRMIDLTPAALGPYVVPTVNLLDHLDAPDVNMVTCGGQATVPVVAAVSQVTAVPYAEIVASIASRSAGPGTRANIDEFTETTAAALEQVGGAARGRAVIVLNPAEPPLLMRDTVFCLVADHDPAAVAASVERMVAAVAAYVPGYRLARPVQVTTIAPDDPAQALVPAGAPAARAKVSVYLEVEGAGHHLPTYAGNFDIMTSAALRVGEVLAARIGTPAGALR